MTVTDEITKLDPTLKIHLEGQWDKDFMGDPGYTSFNDAGVECETGELLYGFVRALQPDRILETGTHWGIGTAYMGLALKANDKGVIDTLEFLPEIRERALTRFQTLGIGQYVHSILIDAAKFQPPTNYDLILLDTEPQTRFAELIKYFEYLKPGGFVFIHDLHRHMNQVDNKEHGYAWPYGKLPEEIKDLVKTDRLRPFHFGTPRGLTGFYKVHEGDHNFIK